MQHTGPFPGERVFLLVFVGSALTPAWLLVQTSRSGVWLAGYCIGLALMAYGVGVLRRVRVARRWPCGTASVVTSRVDDVWVPVESDDGLEYRPLVVYDY